MFEEEKNTSSSWNDLKTKWVTIVGLWGGIIFRKREQLKPKSLQNRETVNIGFDSSVGKELAR